MQKFKTMDPTAITGVVITLIVLSVGAYAFYVTLNQIPDNNQVNIMMAVNNTTTVGNNVFNIIGVVILIGTIMLIVGLVMSYTRPGGL